MVNTTVKKLSWMSNLKYVKWIPNNSRTASRPSSFSVAVINTMRPKVTWRSISLQVTVPSRKVKSGTQGSTLKQNGTMLLTSQLPGSRVPFLHSSGVPPRGGTAHSGRGPPISISNKKCPHRYVHRAIDLDDSSIEDPYF